jgi:hypothetical protein
MRTFKHTLIMLGLVVLAIGCKKSTEPEQGSDQVEAVEGKAAEAKDAKAEVLASLDPRVRRASELAASIEDDPENSEKVLAQANLDREGFDDLMYEIALDADLSSQYRIARGLR